MCRSTISPVDHTKNFELDKVPDYANAIVATSKNSRQWLNAPPEIAETICAFLRERYSINLVFIGGHSAGGFYAYKVARSNVIADLSGAIPIAGSGRGVRERLPTFTLHGNRDYIVSYRVRYTQYYQTPSGFRTTEFVTLTQRWARRTTYTVPHGLKGNGPPRAREEIHREAPSATDTIVIVIESRLQHRPGSMQFAPRRVATTATVPSRRTTSRALPRPSGRIATRRRGCTPATARDTTRAARSSR